MTEHKNNSEKTSVEDNLKKDYIPKSKLGNLPIQNQVDDEIKKKMEKTQKEIEEFKKEITKKFKFIEGVAILPNQANKKIEEEYEISEEDCKKGLIHIVTIIPEKQYKNIGNIRLEAINIARKINDKLWVHILTPVDVWNLGLDSKFEVFEAIAMSYPILDKGLFESVRVAQIHKSLVLKKFEKYVNSYVIYGSLTRGETVKTSDVDVGIIIDDTDVKRMPRAELREKLRGIIYSYIQEAQAIAGTKNILNVQIWLLTEFWDGVKDAHPVFFTFIRDGVPLYDRGTFLPWKSLLRMGKIKPSPEAIDMFMSSGNKLKDTIDKRVFDIATLDLFWGISTPTQGLLMLYGIAPPTPKETVKQFKEIFYDKEKLVTKKYVDILEEIMIKVWKAYEHGKIKPGDISGSELDRLGKNALDYIAKLKEVREIIEKRVQEKSLEEVYEDLFKMTGAILGQKEEAEIIKAFNTEFVKTGKFPPRFLKGLKDIAKLKKEFEELKPKANSKKKEQGTDAKKTLEVDNARRIATEIMNHLMEFSQRCELAFVNKSRYIIQSKTMQAEIFFLKDTFVVQKQSIQKIVGDHLKPATSKEIQEQIITQKDKETKINLKDIGTLEKIFGEFELIQ